MISQQLFKTEQHIRTTLSQFGNTIVAEQERYQRYQRTHPDQQKTLDDWLKRITIYTEAYNLLAEYLTDYVVGQHGVLKYVVQAEKEAAVAKQTLLYLNQLHEERTNQKAILLAERIAYQVMGEQVEAVMPQLNALWETSTEKQFALYGQMKAERSQAYA